MKLTPQQKAARTRKRNALRRAREALKVETYRRRLRRIETLERRRERATGLPPLPPGGLTPLPAPVVAPTSEPPVSAGTARPDFGYSTDLRLGAGDVFLPYARALAIVRSKVAGAPFLMKNHANITLVVEVMSGEAHTFRLDDAKGRLPDNTRVIITSKLEY